jgi:hypothetical protein
VSGTTHNASDKDKTMRYIVHRELNGKKIAFHSDTEFLVQVGRLSKGAYKTRYRFVGNLNQAVAYYNGINIGNGYKKRLFCPTMNNPVLDKQSS